MELLEWLTPESSRICLFVNKSLHINGLKIPDVSRHSRCLATNKLIQDYYHEVDKNMEFIKHGGASSRTEATKKTVRRENGKRENGKRENGKRGSIKKIAINTHKRDHKRDHTRNDKRNDNQNEHRKNDKICQICSILLQLYKDHFEIFKNLLNGLPWEYIRQDLVNHQNIAKIELWINQYALDRSESILQTGVDMLSLPMAKLTRMYSSFVSTDIQHFVEKHFTNFVSYKFSYKNLQANIKCARLNCSLNPSFYKSLGTKALVMLLLGGSDSVHVTLIPTNIPKKLSWKDWGMPRVINPVNVNTGSSYHGICSDISIWRIEESEKVLAHEMGHCLGWDVYPVPAKVISDFRSRFKVRGDIKPCETWVEMWGEFIQLSTNSLRIASKIFNKEKKTGMELSPIQKLKKGEAIFQQLYKWELQWSLFQVAKILHFFGFSRFRDFYMSNMPDQPPYLTQNTAVLSYYICKAALWYQIDKWMDWCHSHKNKFTLTSNDWDEYVALLWSCFDRQFSIIVDYYISIITKMPKDRLVARSFRMTCVEI